MLRSILSLILAISVLVSCGSDPVTEELRPSGINSTFDFDTTKPFASYIAHARDIIASARVEVNEGVREKALACNAPFALIADKHTCPKVRKGVLLVHGLSDSPYVMRSVATYLHKKCFTVYALLLTGHGTRPGDLLEVSYRDWVKQVRYGVKELSKAADTIYLGGYSTGGALVWNHVLTHPLSKIKGTFTFAPALHLPFKTEFARLAKYVSDYLKVYPNRDLAKYESLALNLHQTIGA